MLLPQTMGNVARAILDPLPAYNFTIALIDVTSPRARSRRSRARRSSRSSPAGFSECSGLESSMQPEEHREGGSTTVLRFPQRVTWTNVRLKRGVTISDDLWNWYFAYVQGKGKRRDGLITLQNDLHIPYKVWRFKRGIPVKWTRAVDERGREPDRGRGDRDRPRGPRALLRRAPASRS